MRRMNLPISDGLLPMQLDWARMIESILADVAHGVAVGEISAKFHNTLAEAIVAMAKRTDCARVALEWRMFSEFLSDGARSEAAARRGLSAILASARADKRWRGLHWGKWWPCDDIFALWQWT